MTCPAEIQEQYLERLPSHLEVINGYDIFGCVNCPLQFSSAILLVGHYNDVHDQIFCGFCARQFFNNDHLHGHLHTQNSDCICAICQDNHAQQKLKQPEIEQSKPYKKDIKHRRRGARGTEQCITCDGRFNTPRAIMMHLENGHCESSSKAEENNKMLKIAFSRYAKHCPKGLYGGRYGEQCGHIICSQCRKRHTAISTYIQHIITSPKCGEGRQELPKDFLFFLRMEVTMAGTARQGGRCMHTKDESEA